MNHAKTVTLKIGMSEFIMNSKTIEWILRIAVAGEFIGHGVFALQLKKAWIGWISQLTGVNTEVATQLLFLIGLLDLTVALIVLIKQGSGSAALGCILGILDGVSASFSRRAYLGFCRTLDKLGSTTGTILLKRWI